MAVLNAVSGCYSFAPNLGFAACTRQIGRVIGLLFVPINETWDATEISTLQATINAGLTNTDPALRYHLVMGFRNNEPMNTDQVDFTYASGEKVNIRDTIVGQRMEMSNNFCQYLNLCKWNNGVWRNYRVYEVSATEIEGAVVTNASGVQFSVGKRLSDFHVEQYTYANNTDPARFFLTYQLADATERTLSVGAMELKNSDGTEFSLNNTAGVSTITVGPITNGSAGVLTAGLYTSCSNINWVSRFAAALSASSFKAFNAVTGAAITITSVSLVDPDPLSDTARKVTITLSTADSDYAVGVKARITLRVADTLADGIGDNLGNGAYEGEFYWTMS